LRRSELSDLLSVHGLSTYYFIPIGVVKAVDGIDFSISGSEIVGVAGETGCGKSTAAMSILRLVKPPGKIVAGKVSFKDVNLLELSEPKMRKLRWDEISVVFQQSMYTLNPMLRIEDQMIEALMIHSDIGKEASKAKAAQLLTSVGIEASRIRSFPHELSGGMKQRVLIAMSLICDPELVILDEPTTALDVVIQHRIIKLIRNLKESLGLSVMWITHDLSVLAENSDRIIIMYAGKIVEKGKTSEVLAHPRHPYTKALLDAVPTLAKRGRELVSIPGSPPDLISPPKGCRYAPRCPFATDICEAAPPREESVSSSHSVECHHWREIEAGAVRQP
jgi:oligopeptide/dipeptide ABC transporter ATP-binding protein